MMKTTGQLASIFFYALIAMFVWGCNNRPATIQNIGVDPTFSCNDRSYSVQAYQDTTGNLLPAHPAPSVSVDLTVFRDGFPSNFTLESYNHDSELEEIAAPSTSTAQISATYRPTDFGVYFANFSVLDPTSGKTAQCRARIELTPKDLPPTPEITLTALNSESDVTVPANSIVTIGWETSMTSGSCSAKKITNGVSQNLSFSGLSNSFPVALPNVGNTPIIVEFEVTCDDGLTSPATESIQVTVNPLPQTNLVTRRVGDAPFSQDITINSGESFQLKWGSSFASACAILANGTATSWSGVSGDEVSNVLPVTTTFELRCTDGLNPVVSKTVVVRKRRPAPVITFTANGSSTDYEKPWDQDLTLVWYATNADNCTSAEPGVSGTSGTRTILKENFTEGRTISITCTGDSQRTKSIVITNAARYLYFYYTHESDTDQALDSIVSGNHAFKNFNFKNEKFKIFVHARLLSFINHTKHKYTAADITASQNKDSYAEVTSVQRYSLDGGICGLGSGAAAFGQYRIDQTQMDKSGPVIDLQGQGGSVYLFAYGQRDRYITGNQSCKSVHSSGTQAWGTPVAEPKWDSCSYPWKDSDQPAHCGGYWSNSYGNGAYVYVDASGKLRFKYRTTQARSSANGVPSRVVFLVGIKSAN